jgi:myo-inositol-1(or 4)-monophosphatase
MFTPSAELVTMIEAARSAGEGLMRRFRALAEVRVEMKGPADFVSAADLESEQTLRSALLGAYPSFQLLAEESSQVASGSASERFVVDPLDGTTNFLHGIPHFAIAVALEREGRVVSGLVLDPPKHEMFVAEEGKGAVRIAAGSAEAMRVAPDADFTRALVATGIPHANGVHRHAPYLGMLGATMREAAGIRRLGAAALDLAYVAAGRFAAFFEFGLARWDLAAGSLLVREAGGRVTDPAGGSGFLECGDVLATNGRLHEPMLSLLRGSGPVPR